MSIKKVSLVYFSPTGNTKKAVGSIAKGIGIDTVEYDLTKLQEREKKYSFTENDLVIIGAPVYAGRIPKLDKELFSGLSAQNTPVILVVSYGNRDYDDALLELKNISKSKGFVPIAAGAFIGEHTYSSLVATKRPDQEDIEKMIFFGEQIRQKLKDSESIDMNLEVRGNFPYRKGMGSSSIVPETNDNCTSCMICVKKCPTKAISNENPKEINTSKCIKCFACVKNCPVNAKDIRLDAFKDMIKSLEVACSKIRKEPELFL